MRLQGLGELRCCILSNSEVLYVKDYSSDGGDREWSMSDAHGKNCSKDGGDNAWEDYSKGAGDDTYKLTDWQVVLWRRPIVLDIELEATLAMIMDLVSCTFHYPSRSTTLAALIASDFDEVDTILSLEGHYHSPITNDDVCQTITDSNDMPAFFTRVRRGGKKVHVRHEPFILADNNPFSVLNPDEIIFSQNDYDNHHLQKMESNLRQCNRMGDAGQSHSSLPPRVDMRYESSGHESGEVLPHRQSFKRRRKRKKNTRKPTLRAGVSFSTLPSVNPEHRQVPRPILRSLLRQLCHNLRSDAAHAFQSHHHLADMSQNIDLSVKVEHVINDSANMSGCDLRHRDSPSVKKRATSIIITVFMLLGIIFHDTHMVTGIISGSPLIMANTLGIYMYWFGWCVVWVYVLTRGALWTRNGMHLGDFRWTDPPTRRRRYRRTNKVGILYTIFELVSGLSLCTAMTETQLENEFAFPYMILALGVVLLMALFFLSRVSCELVGNLVSIERWGIKSTYCCDSIPFSQDGVCASMVGRTMNEIMVVGSNMGVSHEIPTYTTTCGRTLSCKLMETGGRYDGQWKLSVTPKPESGPSSAYSLPQFQGLGGALEVAFKKWNLRFSESQGASSSRANMSAESVGNTSQIHSSMVVPMDIDPGSVNNGKAIGDSVRVNEDAHTNLKFYQNSIPFSPDGVKIEEILTTWEGNFDRMEECHAYIQWLFPTSSPSRHNDSSATLTISEILSITRYIICPKTTCDLLYIYPDYTCHSCLPAFLPCCLAALLPSCHPTFLPSCLACCIATLLPCCLTAFLPSCLAAFLPSFLPAFLPSFLPAFLSSCLAAFLPYCLTVFLSSCLTA